jgi:hypothetical protein
LWRFVHLRGATAGSSAGGGNKPGGGGGATVGCSSAGCGKKPGGGGNMVDGSLMGGAWSLLTPVITSISSRSAWTWLGTKGVGCAVDRAVTASLRSWSPARIRSVELASGIVAFVGNHDTVSQMRVFRVSHIHTSELPVTHPIRHSDIFI